jgi:hypothetical protein
MIQTNGFKRGSVDSWMISTIGLLVAVLGLIALSVWLFINYTDQKDNVDSKVSTAVSTAVKAKADSDEAKFFEREKEPNRQFVGPNDYGRVTFDYPKTWSLYVGNDTASSGSYQAYLNPISVPPVNTKQQFAARVVIEDKEYDKVIASYDALVKKGDLKASSVSADGNSGTRLDGAFSKDIRGSAVIFKIRDKTLTIRTDATTFQGDFNKLIATIKFNQ